MQLIIGRRFLSGKKKNAYLTSPLFFFPLSLFLPNLFPRMTPAAISIDIELDVAALSRWVFIGSGFGPSRCVDSSPPRKSHVTDGFLRTGLAYCPGMS